jgi:hypothetical protein
VGSRLAVVKSIHWHGIVLPPEMDYVPGVSFAGIPGRRDVNYPWPGYEQRTSTPETVEQVILCSLVIAGAKLHKLPRRSHVESDCTQ